MKKEEYIENVLKHIQNKAFINTIRQEIEGHIDEREQYYLDCGYDEQTSQQKAIERMGNADELGFKMDMLHDYKKHKIISIIGLIIFVINLIVFRLISMVFYHELIELSTACVSILLAYIVYKTAFAARCRTILCLQGLISIPAALYFSGGLNLTWIFNLTSSDTIIIFIILPTAFMFFIHSVICLTCSAEINTLIQGMPNTKILNRYKSYNHFLFVFFIAVTAVSSVFIIQFLSGGII